MAAVVGGGRLRAGGGGEAGGWTFSGVRGWVSSDSSCIEPVSLAVLGAGAGAEVVAGAAVEAGAGAEEAGGADVCC